MITQVVRPAAETYQVTQTLDPTHQADEHLLNVHGMFIQKYVLTWDEREMNVH